MSQSLGLKILLSVFFFCHAALLIIPAPLHAQDIQHGSSFPAAFKPGERLEYEVSWSQALKAGTAVLEVRETTLSDGKPGLSFLVIGRSSGMIDRVFRVEDRVESLVDPVSMQSVSYSISEHFGRKKRQRSLIFDRNLNVVRSTFNNEPAQTVITPEGAQDSLAFLYYIRTLDDFTIGKVFSVEVHESGKNWTVEVHTMGKERVKTAAGEFETIKIKTRPLQEGVFLNKGEVVLWLTDDIRKLPVLMKSTIKVGSFVFALKDIKS